MQFGKVLPSPTMNEEPHAFAPMILPNQKRESCAYEASSVRENTSVAITERPAPWVALSYSSQGKPKPKGSVAAWESALLSCCFKSSSRSERETARRAGFPANEIARYNSKCARPLTSYRFKVSAASLGPVM